MMLNSNQHLDIRR